MARLLARSAYPAAATRRDLRVDLLRGLCVFAMMADHLGGDSWLYLLTGGNRGYLSAAEGFIFISGLVFGQVYAEKVARHGLGQTVMHAFRRARTLYVVTVVMTLMFTSLRLFTDVALWVPRSVSGAEQTVPELVMASITLHRTYHGTDILAMYVFCVLAAAGGLVLLTSGRWRWLLATSWLVWLAFQVQPGDMRVPWYIRNSENFPLAAWQVLFITALVIGFHRRQLTAWFSAQPGARLAVLGLALAISLSVAAIFLTAGDDVLDMFAKVPLRPARLVAFAAASVLAYAVTSVAWRPLVRATGWLLLPLGQHALYCYIVHFFLIVVIMNIVPHDLGLNDGWLPPIVIGTTLQLGLIVTVWSLVRRRILFGLVPS